jgi:hypothetical protein
MLLALLASIILIIAHHLFYTHLSLHPAPTTTDSFLNAHISRQEFNIALGTALAFLVKACLVFAMGVAFVQVFWREAKFPCRTDKKGVEVVGGGLMLKRLDGMYAAFNSVVPLVSWILWWRFPLLLAMAAAAWYVVHWAQVISAGNG